MAKKADAAPRSLILSFIDRRPDTAARALTAMEADKARALLADIPARHASRVIARMGPWLACERLIGMEPDKVGAILRGLPYQGAAGLLRLMPAEVTDTILRELPRPVRRELRATLYYPADTVGAHMTPAMLSQTADQTVADAREQLRQATQVEARCVVILDEQRRLIGLVDPVLLLRHSGRTTLREIMDGDVTPVSARARISAVRQLPGWNRYLSLPVASRQNHVIGMLSFAALDEALASRRAKSAGRPGDALPVALADAFVGYLGGLLQLVVGDLAGSAASGRRPQ